MKEKRKNTCVRRGKDEKGNQKEGTKAQEPKPHEHVRAACAPEVETGPNGPLKNSDHVEALSQLGPLQSRKGFRASLQFNNSSNLGK